MPRSLRWKYSLKYFNRFQTRQLKIDPKSITLFISHENWIEHRKANSLMASVLKIERVRQKKKKRNECGEKEIRLKNQEIYQLSP